MNPRLSIAILLAGLCAGPLVASSPAFGFFSEIWSYLKQYQLGVDYTNSYDSVNASYEADKRGATAPNCADVASDATRERCQVTMDGGHSSGYGLFLQQAFKRQGLFYFRPDVSFGARYLEGRMSSEERQQSATDGLPLTDMRFSLAALVVKPYIQFGITPEHRWPDWLLSLGPVAQVGIGKVRVNDETKSVAVATTSGSFVTGFLAAEIVFWRFGDGALSVFTSRDITDGRGTKFFPKDVDGMGDFRADFSRTVDGGFFGLGAKLVLDWP